MVFWKQVCGQYLLASAFKQVFSKLWTVILSHLQEKGKFSKGYTKFAYKKIKHSHTTENLFIIALSFAKNVGRESDLNILWLPTAWLQICRDHWSQTAQIMILFCERVLEHQMMPQRSLPKAFTRRLQRDKKSPRSTMLANEMGPQAESAGVLYWFCKHFIRYEHPICTVQ